MRCVSRRVWSAKPVDVGASWGRNLIAAGKHKADIGRYHEFYRMSRS